MYEAFWSLDDSPFVLTPDPRFLLRSKGHHEILTSLLYGITSQKGLMAVIGEVGTGKTTLCRALLKELPKDVRSALVLNPHHSAPELVATILEDLGLEAPRGATRGELMTALGQHLLAQGAAGRTVVVVLDEAQQMSSEALEQIRILSTLETATRKLLQIVLVGQPELEDRLQRRELRQLDQRIGIRCYLRPLSKKETLRYIEHRLRIAGLPGPLPFAPGAMLRIHDYSRGIPRVINLVCDRALMLSWSARAREVTTKLVKAAIRSLEGESRRARRWRPRAALWRAAAAGIVVLALGGGAAAAYRSGWLAMPVRLAATFPSLRTGPSQAVPLAPPMAEPLPASGRVRLELATPPGTPAAIPQDGITTLMRRLLELWGVQEALDDSEGGAWPVSVEGLPDIALIAARYQLAATFLGRTTLAELSAIGLPALVELKESPGRQAYLLRRMEGDTATLMTASGEELGFALDSLGSAWSGSAWVLWRNFDHLPENPAEAMTPLVLAALGARLQKLGYLSGPVPGVSDGRFQKAVRRFQRAAGLPEDGLVGPRTTLALARATGGNAGPTLGELRQELAVRAETRPPS